MFRKTVWFSYALLLCAGYVLSVENNATSSDSKNISHNPSSTVTNSDHPAPSHPDAVVVPSKITNIAEKVNNSNSSENSSVTEKSHPPTDKTTPAPTEKPQNTSVTTTQSTESTPSSSTTSPSLPPHPTTSTVIPVTPQPNSQKGSWNITVKNITCLKIEGEFSIIYNYHFNNTNTTDHIIVPKVAKAEGDCGSITLLWNSVQNKNNTLKFIFHKTKNDRYVLASLVGEVYLKNNQSAHFNTNNKDVHFETPLNQSYSCAAMRQIKVDNHTKITFEEFHLQAFKVSNSTNFDASVDCAGSTQHTPDIVPIVVGCVLALLVIAVLVAYLISRRRSQTRGYLSM